MNTPFRLLFWLFFLSFSFNTLASDTEVSDTLSLQTVYVTKRVFTPFNLSVISQKKIEERRNSSVLPLLTEEIPGLFITSRAVMGYGVAAGAAGGMTVRGIGGSPTSGVLVAINGNPQFMGLMGHPLADSYQTMLAGQVEVITGPMSAQYGSNAMGGLINIITKKAQQDSIWTKANLLYGSSNTLSANAGNAISKGKFNSFVAVDYGRTDGHRRNMNFEQYSGYAKLGYDFSQHWQSQADISLTNFNASNPGSLLSPLTDNDADILRGSTSFILSNKYKHTNGALSFFYNFGNHKINEGYGVNAEPLDWRFRSDDYMLGVSANQSFYFSHNFINLKFDYQNFGGTVHNIFLDNRPDVQLVDNTMNTVAGYLGFSRIFWQDIFLSAGIRADYNQYFDAVEWIPHVTLQYQPAETSTLKATLSKGFRYPTIRELFYLPPRNPALKPENLMNYELSFLQDLFQNKLNLGLTLYYIKGDNSIQTVFVGGAPRFMNSGSVENYGLEFLMKYRINSSFNLSANYAWLNMTYKVLASPEHKIYAGLDYTRGKWRASSGLQYINGLYTTLGNQPQTESFLLWNIRASYRATRWLEVFAVGENLLNQHYSINTGFPMPGTTVFAGVSLSF
jgi:iron complex outermembrane receptor protein